MNELDRIKKLKQERDDARALADQLGERLADLGEVLHIIFKERRDPGVAALTKLLTDMTETIGIFENREWK